MAVKIRVGKPEDFIEVHNLIKEFSCFLNSSEKVKITPDQMVQDQNYFKCLVAANENTIIGFATYFFSYYSWTGKAIYLDDLYVTQKHRGKGIGSMMFDRVMEIGKKENCYKMKWQVSGWNNAAQEFYKIKGAIIDDVEINCDLKL